MMTIARAYSMQPEGHKDLGKAIAEVSASMPPCKDYIRSIGEFVKLLGISGMKESLKKTILGILVWHEQERSNKIPCADAIYNLGHHMVQTLQNVIVEVSPNALALASYPDDPMSLSDSHFVAAYPEVPTTGHDHPEAYQSEVHSSCPQQRQLQGKGYHPCCPSSTSCK